MPLSQDSETRILQLAEALARSNHAVPLTLPPDYLNRALQYLEALARKRGILPPLPSDPPEDPPVPTITKSIGTSSRDYSTITTWEADLDNGAVYASGDTALGECYNDSAFNEAVTINGGGTVGLAARHLSVAAGQRHDGTAGTGARNVNNSIVSALMTLGSDTISTVIDWLEISRGGARANAVSVSFATAVVAFRWLLIHGVGNSANSTLSTGININAGNVTPAEVLNCIIYDISASAGAVIAGVYDNAATAARGIKCKNTTVHGVVQNSASAAGHCFRLTNANGNEFQNCIGTDVSGTTSGSKACFTGTSPVVDHNLSSDATASGTGSLTSKSGTNQFVSIVGGSEDLHLKTGADAIDAGTDLATTPTGVNIDIDGRDRDAQGDTWDMGADEFVSAATFQSAWASRSNVMPRGVCLSHK